MAKDELSKKIIDENVSKSIIPIMIPEKENFIVCDMCGYVNSIKTSICIKCSNYLTEDKK